MEKIGLIAGNKKFPIIFAEAAKKKGYDIVAVAIKGDASSRLKKIVGKVYWLGLKDYSRLFDLFKSERIVKIVMAGQVSPYRLFSKEVRRDARLKRILAQAKDSRADSIFGAIAEELKSAGFELIDPTFLLEDFLPKKGVLTRREPDFNEWEDIYFGLELAKEMGLLDIGQTVAVKQKAVVAVEALEGTDNLIRRAGRIAKKGAIIVKVSKPGQDMRFDIPVVGLNTVKNLAMAKASCLAIEAGKTLFIDKAQSIGLADSRGISIVAV